MAGLLACSTSKTFPSSNDSGKTSEAFTRTYSCGYSSGLLPDSL